ncbi:MAG: hypothetical protein ABIA67_02510 [Candidatus Margulisiibacteriota bacterium]
MKGLCGFKRLNVGRAKILALFLAVAGVVCLLAFPSFAAFPQQINYQGKLTDASNVPVADGTLSIVFTIYDAASGGSSLWTETQSVSTESGFFNVVLGSATSIGLDVFTGEASYLGIKVGTDSEMTPRQQLVSVGNAFYANNADQLDGNHWAAIGTTYVAKAGDTLSGILTTDAVVVPDAKVFAFNMLTATGAPFTVLSTTVVDNLNADQLDGHDWSEVPAGGSYVRITGETMTGTLTTDAVVVPDNKVFAFNMLTATGAPFTVASTTVVDNLNADQLDGNHWAAIGTTYVAKAGDTLSGTLTTAAVVVPNGSVFAFNMTDGSGAPFTVASTDNVTNLNADQLDGHHWSEVPAGGSYVRITGETMTGTLTTDAVNVPDAKVFAFNMSTATGAPFTVASTTKVDNLNVEQVDGKDSTDLVLVDGSQALTGNWDFGSFTITGEVFESDVTTGRSPFVVASTTKVSNLNVEQVDGIDAAATATASQLLALDADKDLELGTGDTNCTDVNATGSISVEANAYLSVTSGGTGIGTTSATSLLTVDGPIATAIRSTAIEHQIVATDSVILVYNTVPITVYLPGISGTKGRQYTIKKMDTSAANVTIDDYSAETIDGAGSYTLTVSWEYVSVVSDGANWFVVADNK